MSVEHCRCCGAVKPDGEAERLEDVKALEYVKRAIEVALSGGHTLVLMGVNNMRDAERLAAISARMGLRVFCPPPCACGYYGSNMYACTCSPHALKRFRRRSVWTQAVAEGELFVEVAAVPYERLSSSRLGEAERAVVDRVGLTLARFPVDREITDRAAQSLMRAATRQLDFDAVGYDRVVAVAATIARMDGKDTIGPVHLAEAIQYRPRTRELLLEEVQD